MQSGDWLRFLQACCSRFTLRRSSRRALDAAMSNTFLQHFNTLLFTPGRLLAHVRDTVLPTPGPRKRAREEHVNADADGAPQRARIKLSGAEEPGAARRGGGADEPTPDPPPCTTAAQEPACRLRTGTYGSSLAHADRLQPKLQAAYLRGLHDRPLRGDADGGAAAPWQPMLLPDPLYGTLAVRPGSAATRAPLSYAPSPGDALRPPVLRYHGPQGGFRALQSPVLWTHAAAGGHRARATPAQVLPFTRLAHFAQRTALLHCALHCGGLCTPVIRHKLNICPRCVQSQAERHDVLLLATALRWIHPDLCAA